MHLLAIVTCFMLAGCSQQTWDEDLYPLRENVEEMIAWWVDSNYSQCMVPVLAELAAKKDVPEVTNFASIFGEDPTPQMLSELERADLAVRPLSLYREADYGLEKCTDVSDGRGIYKCPDGHTPYRFDIRAIRYSQGSQYRVIADTNCGFNCVGSTEYLVERSRDHCRVVSERMLSVS
jgi:hypothetical protein